MFETTKHSVLVIAPRNGGEVTVIQTVRPWSVAAEKGLDETTYSRMWWVYESMQDYNESLT